MELTFLVAIVAGFNAGLDRELLHTVSLRVKPSPTQENGTTGRSKKL